MLLDTQLLVWTALHPERLSAKAVRAISAAVAPLSFSWVSLWEVAIKASLRRPDFNVDVKALHGQLLRNGFLPLPIKLDHLGGVVNLPFVHRDPFDRLLIAQAITEGLTLLTADRTLAAYGPVVKVV